MTVGGSQKEGVAEGVASFPISNLSVLMSLSPENQGMFSSEDSSMFFPTPSIPDTLSLSTMSEDDLNLRQMICGDEHTADISEASGQPPLKRNSDGTSFSLHAGLPAPEKKMKTSAKYVRT